MHGILSVPIGQIRQNFDVITSVGSGDIQEQS